MRDSKAYQLIKLLSLAEWKAVKKWLNSPWANTNKTLIKLYEVLEKGFPEFAHQRWQKENIYQKLYPQKSYNNKIFNNLLSSFYAQLKSFLIHSQLKAQADLEEYYFTVALMERGSVQLFDVTTQTLLKKLEAKPIKDANDYWLLSQLYSQSYYAPHSRLKHQPTSNVLEKAKHYGVIYHQLTDLRYAHDLQIRAALLKNYPPTPLEQTPVLPIQLFQMRLDRPQQWGLAHYQEFKNSYICCYKDLPRLYQQYFFFCCINDSVHLSKVSTLEGIREIFNNYQFGFDHDLLIQSGKITTFSYNNILLTASHLEEYEFAEKFVHRYHCFLESSVQQDGYQWGQAELNYIRQDFNEAIALLQTYPFSDYFFKMQSVGTLLKASFERYLQDETQLRSLLNLCKTKEKYFQRNPNFSEGVRLAYIRFVQYLRRLILLVDTPKVSKQKIETYRKSVQGIDSFFGKGWLLKKVDSLFAIPSKKQK